ncbi:MAG: HEAT repeat domain-containing protein [Armatimonadota bacterium]
MSEVDQVAGKPTLKEKMTAWWALFQLKSQLRADTEGLREKAAKQLGELRDPTAVDALIKAAKDKSPGVRRAAITALGLIGEPRVVEILLSALNDDKRGVKLAVVTALGDIGNSRAVEPLTAGLRDKDPDIRKAATASMVKLGAAAVDTLIGAINDPDEYLRQESMRALGHIKDPRAINPLLAILKVRGPDYKIAADALEELGWKPSKSEERVLFAFARGQFDTAVAEGAAAVEPLVIMLQTEHGADMRTVAARALGQIGDKRAIPALVRAMYDESADVHEAAAGALGQIGDPSAIEPLIAVLNEESPDLRESAIRALGQLHSARAIDPLVSALRSIEYPVRLAAVEALGEIGDPMCVEPLMTAFMQDKRHAVRKAAVTSLMKLGSDVAESLVIALVDEDAQTRVIAADALGQLADPRTVPSLLSTLRDRNEMVRREGAKALGIIGDPRAIDSLLNVVTDENAEVKTAVAKALGQIGDPRSAKALLRMLSDDQCMDAAADALRALVDFHAQNIEAEDLKTIIEVGRAGLVTNQGAIDTSVLVQQARMELSRRQQA